MASRFNRTTPTCPSCDIPWSRLVVNYGVNCVKCTEEEKEKEHKGIDPADFDGSVDPREDFYNYAVGGWKKSNPVPADKTEWGSLTKLHELNQQRLKELVEGLEQGTGNLGATGQKVADFYVTAIDESEAVLQSGLDQLKEFLDKVVSVDKLNSEGLTKALGSIMEDLGVQIICVLQEMPDPRDSSKNMLAVAQGGLGLPDRDYYFDEDKKVLCEEYKKHVAKMLMLAGLVAVEEEAGNIAVQIFDLEAQIAGRHMTMTELRDIQKINNPMTAAVFQEKLHVALGEGAGGSLVFNLPAYLSNLGAKFGLGEDALTMPELNVSTVDPLTGTAAVLAAADAETVGWYLKWQTLLGFAGMELPKALDDEIFAFYGKQLQGQSEQQVRWKRALERVESTMGEALGELYVAKYFPQDFKTKALDVVERVRAALEERLNEVVWMSESTRIQALKKMNSFGTKIGYPDKWKDFSELQVVKGEPLQNLIRACLFKFKTETLDQVNKPTDRSRWLITPQTINAYYHPMLNEIVFPAAILQPPFFDPNADAAVNFGGMGAVIGHEMTHGFDDQGRQFNYEGNVVDWWTKEDSEEYEKRVDVMIKQADQFEVHGQKVKGSLTVGENIADLGGLKLAQRALVKYFEEKGGSADDMAEGPGMMPGLTHRQRFFLNFARVFASNGKKEFELMLLTMDPHGPSQLRVNGTLGNIPEFFTAFSIPEGSSMVKENPVDVW